MVELCEEGQLVRHSMRGRRVMVQHVIELRVEEQHVMELHLE